MPTYIETYELKQRGWTDAMIRKLLPKPDNTRDSDLRIGQRRRKAGGQVKQYLLEKVLQLEETEEYLIALQAANEARGLAAKAQETRKANQEQLEREILATFPQSYPPHVDAATMDKNALWWHHQKDYNRWDLDNMTTEAGRIKGLRAKIYEKHREAFNATYPHLTVASGESIISQE